MNWFTYVVAVHVTLPGDRHSFSFHVFGFYQPATEEEVRAYIVDRITPTLPAGSLLTVGVMPNGTLPFLMRQWRRGANAQLVDSILPAWGDTYCPN